MEQKVLIAGIGNIFLGDDAFGVEVAHELLRRSLPSGITVKDFGIRGFDLAYSLLDSWHAVVLVDAVPRGEAPGTLYTLEVDVAGLASSPDVPMDVHGMDPVKVIRLAASLGEIKPAIYVVGCEPADCGGEEGRMGLTPQVQAAVKEGVQMAEALACRLIVKSNVSTELNSVSEVTI